MTYNDTGKQTMATIRITDLKLRAIIGIYDWEREHKQDVIINIQIRYDAAKACETDAIKDAVDYKAITKRIIKEVEASKFFLLEKLAKLILNIILDDPKVEEAVVRVDKPLALRFADSVSIELTEKRKP
jgi:D-erythro-7,8-dihydroneopterin triphosphate epimerase